MKQLFRTSVAAGRFAVARIKGTQHLNLPPLTRMVTWRSFVNDNRGSGFSVGSGIHPQEIMVDEITGGKEKVDFESIFKQKCSDPTEEMYYDLEFTTGEAEKQYLEYLSKLDYTVFFRHITDFPRKRSEAEKKVIFERYVNFYQRKYPSDEIKSLRFAYFKINLDIIDGLNSAAPRGSARYGIFKAADRSRRIPGESCSLGSRPKYQCGHAPFWKLDDWLPDDY